MYPIAEKAHSINGVKGRMFAVQAPQEVKGRLVHLAQKWVSETRNVEGFGTNGKMTVEIRFDDMCKNGHQTFAITATVYTVESRRYNDCAACGCLHDEIAEVFPELAPLIKWHSCSTDGPTHYAENVLYLAGDRDCWGRAKGEACAWDYGYRFDDVPMVNTVSKKFYDWIEARRAFNKVTPKSNPQHGEFRVVAIAHEAKSGDTYKFKPKYTFAGFGEKWHDCPFNEEATAQGMAEALNKCRVHPTQIAVAFSEGKERELDKARKVAIWPDATDEELCGDPEVLKANLLARLPALMTEFRADMEKAGFWWEPEEPSE